MTALQAWCSIWTQKFKLSKRGDYYILSRNLSFNNCGFILGAQWIERDFNVVTIISFDFS